MKCLRRHLCPFSRLMSRGLYVHIPFCVKKCAYCDFVSFSDCFCQEDRYVDALVREFEHYKGEEIDTVFLGGGTPTSLKTESLCKILDSIFKNFSVLENAEVTVECNPKTADREKLSALLNCGVNRLSIGVQSLDDTVLKAIGRIHSAEDAKNIIHDAKLVGFKNISADIMFGLPCQTEEILNNTIDELCKLPLNHISCYGLILEDGTPLAEKVKKGEVTLPDEDTEFKMYESAIVHLLENGFKRYEISNFAKENAVSRHNIKYWECDEYIGCGVSAHSYFHGVRFSHTDDLSKYIENPLIYENKIRLTNEDKMSEFVMLGLRMDKGISDSEFFNRFKISLIDKYGDVIEKHEKNGLLEFKDGNLKFTPQGVYLSNTVLCEFM